MKTLNKRVFLLLALLAVVLSCGFFTKNVSAATKTGFVTINGKTYYVKEDGSKAKGWMQLGKYKYYFNKKTGVQQKGWMVDRKGRKRYFTSKAGVMLTGWLKDSKGNRRFFDPDTGFMTTGWIELEGETYYMYKKSGVAATGYGVHSTIKTKIPPISLNMFPLAGIPIICFTQTYPTSSV